MDLGLVCTVNGTNGDWQSKMVSIIRERRQASVRVSVVRHRPVVMSWASVQALVAHRYGGLFCIDNI